MSRTSSRRGHDRGEGSQVDPNGWTTAGPGPARPSRVGDLSNFGKISKSGAMTFGPSSIFAGGKKGDAKANTQSLSRQSSINMFSALTQHADIAEPEAPKVCFALLISSYRLIG
jgi:translation initiation factor 4G